MEKIIIFFILVLGILSTLNYIKRQKNIIYVISNLDNRKYLVRKEKDANDAANKLAELNAIIQKLIDACQNTDKENVNLLKENYNPDTLSETIPGSKYTSYSVNKGEKIAICLRHSNKSFMDMNTIVFVTVHD